MQEMERVWMWAVGGVLVEESSVARGDSLLVGLGEKARRES